jgi:hypothetical protein
MPNTTPEHPTNESNVPWLRIVGWLVVLGVSWVAWLFSYAVFTLEAWGLKGEVKPSWFTTAALGVYLAPLFLLALTLFATFRCIQQIRKKKGG